MRLCNKKSNFLTPRQHFRPKTTLWNSTPHNPDTKPHNIVTHYVPTNYTFKPDFRKP